MVAGFRVGQLNRGNPQYVEHKAGSTAGKNRDRGIRKAYKVFTQQWEPQQDEPKVQLYLEKYTWIPDKECWGDMARTLRLREQYQRR